MRGRCAGLAESCRRSASPLASDNLQHYGWSERPLRCALARLVCRSTRDLNKGCARAVLHFILSAIDSFSDPACGAGCELSLPAGAPLR